MIGEKIAADDHLHGLGKQEFVAKLAGHYSELNRLHPFREGNGRATQTFVALLVREGGYIADFTRVDKGAWNVAAARSFEGVKGPIGRVFGDVISPARAVAFDRLARPEAVRGFPELTPAFAALDALLTVAKQATGDGTILRQVATQGRSRISEDLHAGKLVQMPPHVNRALEPVRRGGVDR